MATGFSPIFACVLYGQPGYHTDQHKHCWPNTRSYYSFFTVEESHPSTFLNRHAVMHCGSDYWTKDNAIKMLMFLDLALRIKPAILVLIHGQKALDPAKVKI